MLRATGLAHVSEEAPLVELVKLLAREMDESPSASTATQYRAALSEVRKVLEAAAAPNREPKRVRGVQTADAAAGEVLPEPTSLAKFKQQRNIGSRDA
ncbi:hypothetical protein NS354_01830 [Leucobacter chromiiresistens]|uniref:Uncharacterized protein n=1 Tax=Leucobacter chromiiresistens TaxID=1079994 RepID=A0A147ERK2_9MICO|nr:hypothetical protein NS354_01830 [Leucobacter chromiiresistens]